MELRVKPLRQKDAGRGLAAFDREAMREMGLENGDYAAIEGRERTYGRVWPGYSEDQGEGVVRIDGQLRQAAGVGIDDPVTVEKANVRPADRVELALPSNLRVEGNVESYVGDELGGQVLAAGQEVSVPFGVSSTLNGNEIQGVVAVTTPSPPVVVTDATAIDVADRSMEDLQEAADDSRSDGLVRGVAGRLPGSRQFVAHPVVGVAAVLAFVALLVGGAAYLGRVTGPSFVTWIQVVGTVGLVLLSALTVWHNAVR